jgi:hypothetical protein
MRRRDRRSVKRQSTVLDMPRLPAGLRCSLGADEGGLGDFTMSLDGGFEDVQEFLNALAGNTRNSATSFSNAAMRASCIQIRSTCHWAAAQNCRSESVCRSDSMRHNI